MKKRTSARLTAGFLVVILTAGMIPYPSVPKEVQASERESYQGEMNALKDEEYAEFGLVNNSPEEFDAESQSNPMDGYEPYRISELYIGDMNRDDGWTGSFKVKENIITPSAENLKIDTMKNVGKETSFPYPNNNKTKEVQTNNSCAIDVDGDGQDEILNTTLYVNREEPSEPKRRSKQDIRIYDKADDGSFKAMGRGSDDEANAHTYDIADNNSDDVTYAWNIEAASSKAYTAMTAGDYDGDGKEEGAVYVPSTIGGAPYIAIVSVDDNGVYEKARISLKEFDNGGKSYCFKYKGTGLPVVSLSTTSISGKDDLVISVSLPLKSGDDYDKKQQNSALKIYSYKSGAYKSVFQDYKMSWGDSDSRMRFASAVDTDLNGNGVGELLVAGYKNTRLDEDKGVGRLDGEKNLAQLICWQDRGQTYEYVWKTAKEVEAHDGLKINKEMMEPAALTAGRYSIAEKGTGIFLEGIVASYVGAEQSGSVEADYFKKGDFLKKTSMKLEGGNDAFISTASSASFATGTGGLDQIVILSGDHRQTDNDKVYYDISWIWEDNGSFKNEVTDDNYIHARDEDDGGTFVSLCPLDVDEDALEVEYVGKDYGWSAPELYTVLESAPYWSELPYSPETYGAGATAFSITTGTGTGTEQSVNLGGGFFAGVGLMAGAGLFGTGVKVGFDYQMEVFNAHLNSVMKQHSEEDTFTARVAPGEDYAVIFAVPVVCYRYNIWMPEHEVTQEEVDSFNEIRKQDPTVTEDYPYKAGETAPGHTEELALSTQLNPSLSFLTLEKYNKLAEKHTDKGLTVVKKDDLVSKTIGDPTTYPKSKDELDILDGTKNLHVSPTPASVAVGNGEVDFSYAIEDESGTSEGFKLDFSSSLAQKFEGEVSLGFSGSVDQELGVKVAGGYETQSIKSNSKGMSFDGAIAMLPLGSEEYEFATQLAIYNASHIGTGQAENEIGPYVVTYLVSNTKDPAPPKPPKNLRVYTTTQHEVVLKWDPPSGARAAETYEIYMKQKDQETGDAIKIGDAPAEQGYYVADGLTPSTTYSFSLKAKTSKTESVMGRAVDARTKDDSGTYPVFTTQPESVFVNRNDIVDGEFIKLYAVAQKGATNDDPLAYRWQRYEPDGKGGGTWSDVDNATTEDYNFSINDEYFEKYGAASYYRAVASQEGKSTISRIATVYIVDTQYLSLTDINLTAGDNTSMPVKKYGEEYYIGKDGKINLEVKIEFRNTTTDNQPKPDVDPSELPQDGRSITVYAADEENNQLLTYENIPLTVIDKKNATAQFTVPLDGKLARGSYDIYAVYEGAKDEKIDEIWFPDISNPVRVNVEQLDPDENYYKINYHLDGGKNSLNNPKILTNSSADVTLEEPKKEGAVFKGWYTTADYSGESVKIIKASELTKDLDLYAQWEYISYSITYELGEGAKPEDNPNPAEYTIKDTPIELKAPVRAGYDFKGWYKTLDNGTYKDPVSDIPQGTTGELKLYAKWELSEYHITYVLNGGTNAEKNPDTYTIESPAITLENPVKKGSTFRGWYPDETYETLNNTIEAGSTGDRMFYALWEDPAPFDKDGDTYLISNIDELKEAAELVKDDPEQYASASYRLTGNINGNGTNWSLPIGTEEAPFMGTFEGYNYYIYNLMQNGSQKHQGIFGVIGTGGTVQNLKTFHVVSAGSTQYNGGIASVNNGHIIKCSSGTYLPSATFINTGHINLKELNSYVSALGTAGGITAINNGEIRDCSNSGIVKGNSLSGGIAGENRGVIRNCYNMGNVSSDTQAGGIAGGNYNTEGADTPDGSIFNVYNSGTVTGGFAASIAGTSENTDITKAYYISSGQKACENQTAIDAEYVSASDMRTAGFAQRLNDNRAGTDLKEWVYTKYRNGDYPKIQENNLTQRSLNSQNELASIQGTIHPAAEFILKKQKKEGSDYEQFLKEPGVKNIVLQGEAALLYPDKMQADYDGMLTITIEADERIDPSNLVLLQLTETGEIIRHENKSTKAGVFETDLETLSKIALAEISKDGQAGDTGSQGEKDTDKKSSVATGDENTVLVWAVLLLAALGVAAVVYVRRIRKK